MTPEDHLRAGDLAASLATLQERIRANAADAKLRVFLFQLLCVLGDWNRAVQQLKVAAELDGTAMMMAKTYREAIVCEVFREKVFAGEKSPMVMGEPAEWLAWLIEAQRMSGQGEAAQAADLRARAFDAAPGVPGALEGAPFAWIADADMRLGPVLEVVVNGRYFWLSFDQIARIEADPPADLRDAVWMPVTLTLPNGGAVAALIPTRYAGTTSQGDDAAKLARTTTWAEVADGVWAGIGQRLLTTDQSEVPLMDLRMLAIDQPEGADEAAQAADG